MVFQPNTLLNEGPFLSVIVAGYDLLPSLIDDILIDPVSDTMNMCWLLIDILLASYMLFYLFKQKEKGCVSQKATYKSVTVFSRLIYCCG